MLSLVKGSHGEEALIHSLLEIIANPDLAQKRLEKLTAEKEAIQKAEASAKQAMDAARAATIEANARHAEAQRLTDDFNANHKIRSNNLDERERVVTATNDRLTAYEAQLAAHEKKINAKHATRMTDVDRREAILANRESELEKLEAAAKQIKSDHEQALAKIKDAIA